MDLSSCGLPFTSGRNTEGSTRPASAVVTGDWWASRCGLKPAPRSSTATTIWLGCGAGVGGGGAGGGGGGGGAGRRRGRRRRRGGGRRGGGGAGDEQHEREQDGEQRDERRHRTARAAFNPSDP